MFLAPIPHAFAYATGEEGITKLLAGKKGLIINTHGTPSAVYDEIGMTAGLKITSDVGVFDFTRIEPVDHLLFGSIGYLDKEGYKKILLKLMRRLIVTSHNCKLSTRTNRVLVLFLLFAFFKCVYGLKWN